MIVGSGWSPSALSPRSIGELRRAAWECAQLRAGSISGSIPPGDTGGVGCSTNASTSGRSKNRESLLYTPNASVFIVSVRRPSRA